MSKLVTDAPNAFVGAVRSSRSVSGAHTWATKGLLALADQAVVSGSNFLTAVLVGRLCGAEQLGVYALAFTFLVVAVNIQASLVTAPYTFFANHVRGRRRRILAGSSFVHLGLLMPLVVLAGLGIAVGIGFHPPTIPAVSAMVTATCAAPFVLLREYARRLAFAELKMTVALMVDVSAAMLQLAGLLLLWKFDRLSGASAHWMLGLSSAIVGLVWLIRSWGRSVFIWPKVGPDWCQHWLFGKWVLADQMLAVGAGFTSQWLLGIFLSTAHTGMFVACMNVVQLTNPLIFGLGNLIEPRMSAAVARGGWTAVRRMMHEVSLGLSVLLALMCTGFAIFGNQLVGMLYQDDTFVSDPWIIPLLALTVFATGMSVGVLHALRATYRSHINVLAGIATFAITLIIGLVWVAAAGLRAAACAMMLGQLAGLFVRWLGFYWSSREVAELNPDGAAA